MTTATLKSLSAKVRLDARFGARLPTSKQDNWQRSANGWTCTLRYQGRRYTFDYWQGSAISHDPDAEGCLECLLSDAQAGEQDFHNFCSDMGYDEDSRKAEATWRACQRTAREMRRLLGGDFDLFAQAER